MNLSTTRQKAIPAPVQSWTFTRWTSLPAQRRADLLRRSITAAQNLRAKHPALADDAIPSSFFKWVDLDPATVGQMWPSGAWQAFQTLQEFTATVRARLHAQEQRERMLLAEAAGLDNQAAAHLGEVSIA